ncbi:MAG: hypothetical protein CMN30_11770 [Sandaracinus sp.]|nr:hypothetical protein [Sandaracinus sp.]|tara:strand:- start:2059 stop:2319 length:261 start_codon:yes stop_codon:yes gene_type:complete
MKRFLLSLGLVLSFATAGCGDNEGSGCEVDGDCDSPLVCGQLAICDEPGNCFGVCTDVCEVDDDCPGDTVCRAEPGGARLICRGAR